MIDMARDEVQITTLSTENSTLFCSLSSYIRCIPEINRLTNGHEPRGMAEYEYIGVIE